MPYTQLYYHVVWATKNRAPFITPEAEPLIYNFLRSKAIGLGAIVYAMNGLHDHVHLVVAIPAKIAVAKFIGQVKATATARFNKSGHPHAPIYWQSEYAVFSTDKKRLPYHIRYVERQKQHHSEGGLIPILERIDGANQSRVRESQVAYHPDTTADWIPE